MREKPFVCARERVNTRQSAYETRVGKTGRKRAAYGCRDRKKTFSPRYVLVYATTTTTTVVAAEEMAVGSLKFVRKIGDRASVARITWRL